MVKIVYPISCVNIREVVLIKMRALIFFHPNNTIHDEALSLTDI